MSTISGSSDSRCPAYLKEIVLKTPNSIEKPPTSQERMERVRTALLALNVLMKVPTFITKSLELFTRYLGS